MTKLLGVDKAIIGMVHLLPLPGSPRWDGDMEAVLERAEEDAVALGRAGVDAVMVENFGDAPYVPGSVGPHTVAAMALAVERVRRAVALPVGVNVLRNDAAAALAVAVAAGASFIRVNVHTGAVVADEGLIQGRAHQTLRYRRALGADGVLILADVLVKHAAPLGEEDPVPAARTAAERGLADAVILSGPVTGEPPSASAVEAVKAALPRVPVLVGSGLTADNAGDLLAAADGAIVGTSLKQAGVVTNPVDPRRATDLMQVVRRLRGPSACRGPSA